MIKSELISKLSEKHLHLDPQDVSISVNLIVGAIASALVSGRRTEIRDFGTFAVRYRPGKIGRNPMTGEAVAVPGKYVPYFRAGLKMRERVDSKD